MGYALGTPVRPQGVKFVLTTWDGWDRGVCNTFGVGTTFVDDASPDNAATRYGFRRPATQAGTQWLYSGSTGDSATEQARMDDELAQMGAIGACRAMFWYPRQAEMVSGTQPASYVIRQAIDHYMASPNKSQVPFAIIISGDKAAYDINGNNGTWLNFSTFKPIWINSFFKDPQYIMLHGNRPLIYIYNNPGLTIWDTAHLNSLSTDIQAAGLGAPCYVSMNYSSSDVNSMVCYGFCGYGPSGNNLTGTHNAYSAQVTKDRTNWTMTNTVGAVSFLSVTPVCDGRPRRGEATWWGDVALYSEWEQHLRNAALMARSGRLRGSPDAVITAYSGRELDEGGDFMQTLQTRGQGPAGLSGYGPMCDAVKAVLTGNYPATWNDIYHADSIHANLVHTGAWSLAQDLSDGGGAWRFCESRSSTAGNTLVLTIPSGKKVTGFQIYGSTNVGLGTFTWAIDGGGPTSVSCAAGSLTRSVLLASITGLSATNHTLTLTISANTLVGFDRIVANMSR